MKLSAPWRWTLVTVLFILLALSLSRPLPGHFSELVLGTPCNDLFDEINIHTTVTRNLLQGQSPFHSDNLDFPINRDLLVTHKTFLHILFAAPLIAALDWPLWWNVILLIAIFSGVLAACYTLVKISRSWMIGILLGLSFLGWQWLRETITWGHLVQLWTAPLYLAIFCLVGALTNVDNRRYCWGLGIFTLITAFIYWIWGGAIAVLGALGLFFRAPDLQREQLKRLGYTVAITALIAIPTALYVLNLNPNLPILQQGGGIEEHIRLQALERASNNTVLFARGEQLSVLPGGVLIAPVLTLATILAFAGACKLRNKIGFWSACASIFFLIGWGPYLKLGHYTFTYADGQPVRLPYYYLMDWSGLGYRWQTPSTLTPLVMICLALATALAWRSCQKRFRWSTMIVALALTTSLLGLTVQGASGAGRGNAFNNTQAGGAQQIEGSFFPMFAFRSPTFVTKLRTLPRGALLEFPLGYVGNVWQLQHLHGQPTCLGRHPVVPIMERNGFVLWLYRYSRYLCRDLGLTFIPDVQSSEILYGQTQLPEQLRYHKNRYPIMARPLDRSTVAKDYVVMRQELEVRYAVLHRANCSWYAPGHGAEAYERLNVLLQEFCGAPLYSDSEVAIFAWPNKIKLTDRYPWDATLAVPSEEHCDDLPMHGPIPE